ncbi:MAG: DUF4157 domain-containing protein, partial [Kofleriaceae bacterium]
IQASFGHHDISGVRAHVGGAAATASGELGARAYASGDQVGFAESPDLFLAAHEAAHVVQQRGGVQLAGGIGDAGDIYEQHADGVAAAVVRGESAEQMLDAHAGGAGSMTLVQRDIDPALLRARIGEMRAENAMVLYVDAVGGSRHAFYQPAQGVEGSRDVWDPRFLRQSAHRRLLRDRFRGHVDYLVGQRRWDTLYWLHTEFPSNHLPNAAPGPLQELQRFIQTQATAVQTESGTGWDEIQNAPTRRRADAAESRERGQQARADVTAATQAVTAGLRAASGTRLHRIVYSTAPMRTLGGHTHTLNSSWAHALARYLRTLNELRQGRRPSMGGGIPGAPTTSDSYMVDAATATWRGLSEQQRTTLTDDDQWATLVRNVWPTFQERLSWGIQEAGSDQNPDTLDGGRWRNPGQDLH